MAITRTKTGLGYADHQRDIRAELVHYADHGEGSYLPTKFADVVCRCGRREFFLELDPDQTAAVRTCATCGDRHVICDGADYLDDVDDCDDQVCLCGLEIFEITIGVHLYRGSKDVKWLYIGCRCPACGLAGNYGDWKNEFEDYKVLLKQA